MSYQIKLSPKSRRAARFIRSVHREIQKAFARAAAEEGLTQQDLANKLEVNRATINKRLLGHDNLTLRTIAELAWALDREPEIRFKDTSKPDRANAPAMFSPSLSAGSVRTEVKSTGLVPNSTVGTISPSRLTRLTATSPRYELAE